MRLLAGQPLHSRESRSRRHVRDRRRRGAGCTGQCFHSIRVSQTPEAIETLQLDNLGGAGLLFTQLGLGQPGLPGTTPGDQPWGGTVMVGRGFGLQAVEDWWNCAVMLGGMTAVVAEGECETRDMRGS